MDPIWTALALVLSGAGGMWTVRAFRTRGVAPGLRGAGLTLLPLAALMTGTLELMVDIGVDIGDWAVGLAFSPVVWLGIILAGTAVVLWGAGTVLGRREVEAAPAEDNVALPPSKAGQSKAQPAMLDDDMADIEAILKRRGIS